ncbi:FxsA family protein [Hoyosella rhizosphaerae]|uniref:FxsA family protein n=1 Tax=Hoyosella rhizosphaerae TaxID=1755582 RepID=A0A916XA89_9ACTN|nr:FxsA family protein [Hoyosella rhizosphaerae]MBN4926726.1 FxsA family protein [Hoyosella rhizosphaerae]GGC56919.1 hypothetical protein GCM10011410_06800 [Hoyosella rhizosphaerae]
MILLTFLTYVVVEIATIVVLVKTVGLLWTLAIVVASFVLGLVLFASQSRTALRQLAAAVQGVGSPANAVADTALVALAGLLLAIPGVATSVLGLLVLFPPTRKIMRPAILFVLMKKYRLAATAGSAGFGAVRTVRHHRGTEVIDGEVVDGDVVNSDIVEEPASGTTTGESTPSDNPAGDNDTIIISGELDPPPYEVDPDDPRNDTQR